MMQTEEKMSAVHIQQFILKCSQHIQNNCPYVLLEGWPGLIIISQIFLFLQIILYFQMQDAIIYPIIVSHCL